MSRRKRGRYWAGFGLVPARGAGLVSVAISAAAGGDVKSLRLSVSLPPRWQGGQPPSRDSWRPCATALASWRSGAAGVRIAERTHSRSAVIAGIGPPPGSGAGGCGRAALGLANALTTHGPRPGSLSPVISPWCGSLVELSGGGAAQGSGVAVGPGPE